MRVLHGVTYTIGFEVCSPPPLAASPWPTGAVFTPELLSEKR